MSSDFSSIGQGLEAPAQRKSAPKKIAGKPSESTITRQIGTGDDAKNSIVWITVRWCFIIGGLTSLAIYLRPVYCGDETSGNLMDDIKSVWTVFMPVVTLALGYVFGKGR